MSCHLRSLPKCTTGSVVVLKMSEPAPLTDTVQYPKLELPVVTFVRETAMFFERNWLGEPITLNTLKYFDDVFPEESQIPHG